MFSLQYEDIGYQSLASSHNERDMVHDPPVEVAASWPPPNFSNPQSKGLTLVIVELLLISIVCVVVLLRIYSRVYLRKTFGLDDWLILPATVFCIGLTTTTCLATLRYGWGRHIWDVPTASIEKSLKLSWTSELFFTWSLALTKLSLCFFYLRLLGDPNTHNGRRSVQICICIVTLWALGFTAAIISQCNPVKAVWIINYPGERCVDIKAGVIAHAALDITTDLFIYILPIPRALSSQLPRRQKHLLVGLFAVGGIVCTAAVIRVPYTLRSMSSYDTTWYIYDSYIWTTLEADLAIICACMPSLAPILAKVIPNFYSCSAPGDQQLSRCTITKGSTNMPYSGSLTPAFPLAHISTTASSTAIVGNSSNNAWYQHWYNGGAVAGGAALNESEENIISSSTSTDILTDITTARGVGCITKTTVIEQSVSVDSRTPSPKVANPLAMSKI